MQLIHLQNEIENCRYEMISLAMKTSLSDIGVVELSKKLDHLLNEYQTNQIKWKQATYWRCFHFIFIITVFHQITNLSMQLLLQPFYFSHLK